MHPEKQLQLGVSMTFHLYRFPHFIRIRTHVPLTIGRPSHGPKPMESPRRINWQYFARELYILARYHPRTSVGPSVAKSIRLPHFPQLGRVWPKVSSQGVATMQMDNECPTQSRSG